MSLNASIDVWDLHAQQFATPGQEIPPYPTTDDEHLELYVGDLVDEAVEYCCVKMQPGKYKLYEWGPSMPELFNKIREKVKQISIMMGETVYQEREHKAIQAKVVEKLTSYGMVCSPKARHFISVLLVRHMVAPEETRPGSIPQLLTPDEHSSLNRF